MNLRSERSHCLLWGQWMNLKHKFRVNRNCSCFLRSWASRTESIDDMWMSAVTAVFQRGWCDEHHSYITSPNPIHEPAPHPYMNIYPYNMIQPCWTHMDLGHQSFIKAIHLITSCKSWGRMKSQRVCSVLRKLVAMGNLWIPVHLLNLKVCPPPLVRCRCLARLGIMMLTCVGNRFARDLAWFTVKTLYECLLPFSSTIFSQHANMLLLVSSNWLFPWFLKTILQGIAIGLYSPGKTFYYEAARE